MKTILVPTDLSDGANAALPVAVQLAARYGAEVRVLHYVVFQVIDTGLAEGAAVMARYTAEQERNADARLNALCARYQTDAVRVIPVLSRHEKGLYGAVAAETADLVVLHSHGEDDWTDWLVGSNAENFVQTADCPVLVLKGKTATFDPEKILLALDDDDRLLTQFAYPLAEGAETTLLFVATPNDPRDPQSVQAWLQALARMHTLTSADVVIRHHRVAHEAIIQYAQQHGHDLIVLFTSQRSGFLHFLNGSVAEDVVNHAPLPVLVVPFRSE